jgi:D-alanine transaminase
MQSLFILFLGVYEVTTVLGAKLVDYEGHYARLLRSLGEMNMPVPISSDELLAAHRTLVSSNNIVDGMVYLQVTRGSSGDRDFIYPNPTTTPCTVVMFTQNKPGLAENPLANKGIRVITIDDLRWGRRDIKTIQLLYPSMGKMMAVKAGVDDAWFIQDGFVTEGTSNNTYIVKDGKIITRALSSAILPGITRSSLLRYAQDKNVQIEERSFTVEEALAADEAFASSATLFVMPVVEIDGKPIGNGKPGAVTAELRKYYLEESRKSAI